MSLTRYEIQQVSGRNVARAVDTSTNHILAPRGVIAPQPGRTYRATVRYRVTGTITFSNPADTRVMNIHWRALDGSYAYTHAVKSTSGYAPDVGWQTEVLDLVCDEANVVPLVRPTMYFRGGDFSTTGICEVEEFRVEDVTEAAAVGANLENNYYTAADTDGAIAARELLLQAQIDGTNADLAANYYTSAEADNAIALREAVLQAAIDNTASADLPSDFAEDGKYWTSDVAGAPGAAPLSSKWGFSNGANEGRKAVCTPASYTGSVVYLATRGCLKPVRGRRYRLTVRCRLQGNVTPISGVREFSLWIRELDDSYGYVAVHGFQDFHRADGSWNDYAIEVECDSSNVNAYWRAGMYIRGNDFSGDGNFEISKVIVEDITNASNLGAEITDIKAVDVNALAGTALGVLLTELEVDAGGTPAKITAQGNAIADLEGNASAGYLIKAQSGSEVSLLQLVAANGSGGAVSVAKLEATDILLDGSVAASQLAVTDLTGNLWVNGNFFKGDGRGWGALPGSWTIEETGPAKGTNALQTATARYVLKAPADASDRRWYQDEQIPIEGGATYSISVDAAGYGASGDDPEFQIILSCSDAEGNYAGGHFTIMTQTDGNTWQRRESTWTAPADAVVANASVRRLGSGTQRGVCISNIQLVKKRDGATLLTPNSVTTQELAANAVTAEKANFQDLAALNITVKNADIDNLTIGGSKMQANAVTKVRRATGSDPSITWTPNIDGEMTALLFAEAGTYGGGPGTSTVQLRCDGVIRGGYAAFASREDISPGQSSGGDRGMVLWKDNVVNGVPYTVDVVRTSTGGGASADAILVVIETKR